MSNVFKLKTYSFTTKIIVAFLFIIMIFLGVRAVLIIPKIQKQNEKDLINNISSRINLIKNQFSLVGKSIVMQKNLETELLKQKIVNQVKDLQINSSKINEKKLIEKIKSNKILNICSYKIHKNIKKKNLDSWIKEKTKSTSRTFKKMYIYKYNYKFKNSNLILTLSCNSRKLNPSHYKFEKSLKKIIYKNLSNIKHLKSTKIAIFWVNAKLKQKKDEVLFSKNAKKGYFLSHLSNVKNIPTGNLTLNQLLNNNEKGPILHKFDQKDYFTWVSILYSKKNSYFILVYTVNKEQIDNKKDSGLFFLLKESLLAIAISIFIILFFFRKALLNINTITKTAIKVNQGYKNIRSGVKGEDDIGNLGQAFDSMLNFFENSIKTLDIKVEEKTKEISKSLEEKEILLKEIHHRVKNNLALTIGLIELQEEEVKDKKTKKALIDIKERIFTMELLHRKLYESENINYVSLKDYVEDLVSIISHSYSNNKISINLDIENINLNIQKAMPCAIVLNELITNCFKYAFKDNLKPNLQIKIFKEDNLLTIIVKDNGVGLKQEFTKINEKTLGLKLINTIVKFQLFGSVKYEYESGAKFIIIANIDK